MARSHQLLVLATCVALFTTASAAVEWNGVFAVSGTTHTWSMQQKGGKYADPSMKLVIIPTENPTKASMEAVEDKGKTLMAGSCEDVTGGGKINPVACGKCFNLKVTANAATTTFEINTTGLKGIVFFAQHVPTEFENTKHYFYDSANKDIEPVAQEGGAGGHSHSHDAGTKEKCECVSRKRGFKIDCSKESMDKVRAAVSYLEANKPACRKKSASKTCHDNYYVMQAHHDYCSHKQLPAAVGNTIHDFESFYDDCLIKRQYDSTLKACPAVKCADAKTTLATADTTMLNANCSGVCKGVATCANTFKQIVRAHDDCSESLLPPSVEKALHKYEDICEEELCNTVTQPFALNYTSCPAAAITSGARANAAGAALLAAGAAFLAFA